MDEEYEIHMEGAPSLRLWFNKELILLAFTAGFYNGKWFIEVLLRAQVHSLIFIHASLDLYENHVHKILYYVHKILYCMLVYLSVRHSIYSLVPRSLLPSLPLLLSL